MHLVSLRRRRWATALFLVGTACVAVALLLVPGEVGVQTRYGNFHSHAPRQLFLEIGFFSYAAAFLVMVLKRTSRSRIQH